MNEQKYPEPTAGVLILNEENKIFLMTSPKWKGKYVISGGHKVLMSCLIKKGQIIYG